jgi:hypothetical protein
MNQGSEGGDFPILPHHIQGSFHRPPDPHAEPGIFSKYDFHVYQLWEIFKKQDFAY